MRAYFSPRLLLAGITFGFILLAGVLAILWFTRPANSPSSAASAVIHLTPAPSATQSTPTVQPSATATPDPGNSERLVIGKFAQVTGTGGDGLRLRSEPNLQAEIRLVASEGEIFTLQDGPREVDGYTWYLLIDPDDSTRQGWAVASFLLPER